MVGYDETQQFDLYKTCLLLIIFVSVFIQAMNYNLSIVHVPCHAMTCHFVRCMNIFRIIGFCGMVKHFTLCIKTSKNCRNCCVDEMDILTHH